MKTKSLLWMSLIANLCLVSAVVFLVAKLLQPTPPVELLDGANRQDISQRGAAATKEGEHPNQEPFSSRQVESRDYRTTESLSGSAAGVDQLPAFPVHPRPRAPAYQSVSMPVAFQPVAQGSIQLNSQEINAFEEVQRTFQEAVGVPVSADDPDYRQKWQIAQRVADSMLRAQLGAERYYEYVVQASKQSEQATGP